MSKIGPAAALIGLIGWVAAPSSARADEDWYGWQTMAVDGGAYVAMVGGISSTNALGLLTGLSLYFVGAPLVHVFHDEPRRGGIDLGVRIAAPAAGAALSGTVFCPGGEDCGFRATIGAAVGIVVAQVIDAAVLAYADGPTSATPRMITLGGRF